MQSDKSLWKEYGQPKFQTKMISADFTSWV